MNENETPNNEQPIEKKSFFSKCMAAIRKSPKLRSIILYAIAIALILGLGYYFGISNIKQEPVHEEKVTELSFKDIGELNTQEAYVTVVENLNDDRKFLKKYSIPFTESICIFSHDFKVTVGYNFEDIEYTIREKNDLAKGKITIELPEQKLETTMLPDKEEVYYEKESIFRNLTEEAKATLREKMALEAENTAIGNKINAKAESHAKQLLQNFTYSIYNQEDYDIVFKNTQYDEEQ